MSTVSWSFDNDTITEDGYSGYTALWTWDGFWYTDNIIAIGGSGVAVIWTADNGIITADGYTGGHGGLWTADGFWYFTLGGSRAKGHFTGNKIIGHFN